jgi:creatinine amidohydrolase/Fe(II)-dependent formamide hydrolase-like protein
MSFFTRLLILPTGSYEYHGKELPPDTDNIIACGIAGGLASSLSDLFNSNVLVLPPVNYGFSIEHTGQPSTAIISHNVFYSFLRDLVSSITIPRDFVVIINGHGGNVHTIGALEGDFNCTFQDRKLFFPPLHPAPVKDLCVKLVGEIDVHAGSVEASLVAHYLDSKERKYEVRLGKTVRGSLRFFRSKDIAPDGVIARHPTVVADPKIGKEIHEAIVRETKESVVLALESLSEVLEGKDRT